MVTRGLLLGVLLTFCSLANAASPVEINPAEEQIDLFPFLSEWRESSPVPGDGFIHIAPDLDWTPVTQLNKGYIDSAYWYRIKLRSANDSNQLRLLELAYPLLDKVDVYAFRLGPDNDRPDHLQPVQQYSAGDRRPFHERPISARTLVFPLMIPASDNYYVYLRVETEGSHQIPLRLWNADAFIQYSNEEATYRALYYGSQVMLIVFILCLFLLMREKVYLLFSITLFGVLMVQASMHGVLFQYLIPNYPTLNEYIVLMSVPFTLLFMALFTMDYLELKRNHKGWFRMFQVIALICAGALLSVFLLPYQSATYLGVVLSAPVSLIMIWVGVKLWLQGTKTAQLFTIAWAALLTGALVLIFNQLGILSFPSASQYSIPLGSSIQALLLAYALADRFQKDRNDRVKAQEARLIAIQHKREAERSMVRTATRHQVTSLCNRQVFEQALAKVLQQRNFEQLAIVFLHITGFNDFNKTLGHQNSDELIKLVAQRLNKRAVATPHIVWLDRDDQIAVANIETVTFGCIIKNLNREKTLALAQELAATIYQPTEFKGLSIEFSVQSGCAFSDGYNDVSTLQRHAFIAFGNNRPHERSVTVYEPGMDAYSPRRLTLMTELRKALTNNELELYYQPQIELATGRVTGFEALLRWTHSEYGAISPDEFIPIAEETGQIREITPWVTERALGFIRQLENEHDDICVSVNISVENLHDQNFPEQIQTIVANSGSPARKLILEITETAAMQDPNIAINALIALSQSGVKIALDDFGTGYCSLTYL